MDLTKLAHWHDEVDKSEFLSFGTVARTIQTHNLRIVAIFRNHATNPAKESFNAKIKQFRAQLRVVKDISFFFSDYPKFMLKISIPQDFCMIQILIFMCLR